MQKIVIDTNVMVSSIIQRNFPYFIINELFLEEKFELCISDELMKEYYQVLSRPKFTRFHNFYLKAETLLAEIETRAIKYYPTITLEIIKDDDDNRILELADECKADFIITGNTKDFNFKNYKKTEIISPKDFWEKFEK
jgi:putative PIN family toxin of toxin-antitoxin system